MAVKIKIKHNVTGKTLPLHLKYEDSNLNLPEAYVDITDREQTIELTGWTAAVDGISVDKISVSEEEVTEGDTIYKINSVNIGMESGANTASEEVEEQMSEREPSTISEPTCEGSAASNWDAIVAAHNAKNYTERTRLIKEDESKFFYDRSEDIRHTTYNESHYTDASFAAKYGSIVSSALLTQKAGVLSYGSIYFGPVLIEANSRYARIKDWEKSTLMTQTINEEGRKNGATSHGYMTKNQGTQVLTYRTPDLTSEIYEFEGLYSGVEENSSVLTICLVPSYTEASSSYRPCIGDFYVDGVKVESGKAFVRVRIDNGNHVVYADNVNFMEKTEWSTLGNHHITTPLYSDGILKIVVFNDNEDHGIYPRLYLQAKNNKWGLPCNMFES